MRCKLILSFVFITFFFTFFQTCKSPLVSRSLDFVITNQTIDTIVSYIPPVNEALSSKGLPLTRPSLKIIIPPNDNYLPLLSPEGEGTYFEDLPTDTFHIFILNYSVYRTQNWSSIVSNNLILERIKITEDSLKAIEYNIIID